MWAFDSAGYGRTPNHGRGSRGLGTAGGDSVLWARPMRRHPQIALPNFPLLIVKNRLEADSSLRRLGSFHRGPSAAIRTNNTWSGRHEKRSTSHQAR